MLSKFVLIALLATLGLVGCHPTANGASQDPLHQAAEIAAVVGAAVIPMDREGILHDHTVVVAEGRIVAVGPTGVIDVPPDAKQIEARGAFLVPGLADMHVHLLGEESRGDLAIYVANGIATIRNMYGEPRHLRWRDEIADGTLLGPTLYSSGPFVGQLRSAADAENMVHDHKRDGYDFIKIHVAGDRYEEVASSARAYDMPVVGHVPVGADLEAVLGSGQRTLEHAENLMQAFFDERNPDTAQIPQLVGRLSDSDVCVTPTLVVFEHIIRQTEQYPHTADLLARPELRFVGSDLLHSWQPSRNPYVTRWADSQDELPAALTRFQQQFEFMRYLTLALHDAGVPLLAGTDASVSMVIPGFSLLEELRLLVEAGLTPYDALRTATYNPAVCMDRAGEFGTITSGARADLVLLERNPLEGVDNLRMPLGVMIRGRWLPASDLGDLLEARASRR